MQPPTRDNAHTALLTELRHHTRWLRDQLNMPYHHYNGFEVRSDKRRRVFVRNVVFYRTPISYPGWALAFGYVSREFATFEDWCKNAGGV